ncbi:MAG: aminotransferase class I/II-fold pyridoxal phosphate-dependent enzyme [Euryarchaeota archaeon]|nr:aminotransferase class I/II-fold pyridoxal phosphate-dependent enzyme [Euryarchaeota archaeon]MDE1879313.1 aminotransferase class I/II-fold pyridoxal phosphate-dependent enzyme [Euryarchaeota archaeon]MDE2044881.1 aminotransferase class I/II-fold pyridoxal phosphate-dependent enzyme [Thermoplasmata archaeon]
MSPGTASSPRPTRRPSSRVVQEVPPYPFAELERKAAAWSRGKERAINLSIGDPDLPPPPTVVEAARKALVAEGSHRYPTSRGDRVLLEAIARWMERRFDVKVDPEKEVAVLLGSKEGIGGLPHVLADPGEAVLVPDPGYPPYTRGTRLAHAEVQSFPLLPSRGWLPDWDSVPTEGRLMFLNYPNNPTGGTATLDQVRPAVDIARDRGMWLAYDNAYSEVTFEGFSAPSILQVPGAIDHAIEFHSFSKTFGMAGWRIGFAVGNREVLASLVKYKSQNDSGAARPIQAAAAAALDLYRSAARPPEVERSVDEYGRRLRRLSEGLRALGYDVTRPRGSLYLWQHAPLGDGSAWADELLAKHGILVTPGAAFGPSGTAYVRWAVTVPFGQIEETLRRLSRAPGPS